jgi:hypothetical protein
VHQAVTAAIRTMVKGVLFGAGHTTAERRIHGSLQERESDIAARIRFYRRTAAVEGGITGAGGLLLGLADFPLLLAIKIKLLFEIASQYGFDVHDYRERVYLLHIFELAFSSDAHRRTVYLRMEQWQQVKQQLPARLEQFDWRRFQQEYRDYIDLAKMAQLIPVVGAPVGAIVNDRLLRKLGETAMHAYRMRMM